MYDNNYCAKKHAILLYQSKQLETLNKCNSCRIIVCFNHCQEYHKLLG